MTNAELIDFIMSRLGRRTSANLRPLVLQELNAKKQQLEGGALMPWYLEAVWVDVLVPAQAYLPLPADFGREQDDGEFELQDPDTGSWLCNLVKVDYPILRRGARNVAPTQPKGYSLVGDQVFFGPTPSLAYVINLPYYKKTEDIEDDAEDVTNPWILNHKNLLVLETMLYCATTHFRDPAAMQRWSPLVADARANFLQGVEGRKHAGRTYLLDDEEN